MDPVIAAAARALAAGDALAALKRVALRDDPPALAIRGIAMARIGDLGRARELLRTAARGFGRREPVARARCRLAEAEIALVTRDLTGALAALAPVRQVLAMHGDHANAAHAACQEARLLLLIGRLDTAERVLAGIALRDLPAAARPGYWLVVAGIAMRRVRAEPARAALRRAERAAQNAAIPALMAEVDQARRGFDAPAARVIADGATHPLTLAGVEALYASGALVADACRSVLRMGGVTVALGARPVLFGLLRTLAEAWPGDAPRELLLKRVFGARHADDSHRARLRVEIGRLRAMLAPVAGVAATVRGFRLDPSGGAGVAVLVPPVEGAHGQVLALLADGEGWSSSALALALGISPRTVQRALGPLASDGKIDSFGRGPARRWTLRTVPGFPTSLLLPAPLPRA